MSDRQAILTLYSRTGCHLCEEMVAELLALQREHPFRMELLEIDGNAELERGYGERIPVLLGGGRELCEGRLDVEIVRGFLEALNP